TTGFTGCGSLDVRCGHVGFTAEPIPVGLYGVSSIRSRKQLDISECPDNSCPVPLSLTKVSISFGGPPLLDNLSLALRPGERACIVGRNGAGKSTLLKIAAGVIPPDSGEIYSPPGERVAYRPQEIPDYIEGKVSDVVRSG